MSRPGPREHDMHKSLRGPPPQIEDAALTKSPHSAAPPRGVRAVVFYAKWARLRDARTRNKVHHVTSPPGLFFIKCQARGPDGSLG